VRIIKFLGLHPGSIDLEGSQGWRVDVIVVSFVVRSPPRRDDRDRDDDR
jgi:hypothetical protein